MRAALGGVSSAQPISGPDLASKTLEADADINDRELTVISNAPARYRLEEGRTCVDIKVRSAWQLFDGRDPAPFRERDLDEDAVEYILDAVQEISVKSDVRIVFWITEKLSPEISAETIVEALRAHFTYEIQRLDRGLRDHVRLGQFTLAVGLAVLTLFLSLAELTLSLAAGHLRQILREGLVITGWVALWRPLEVLLYDWWPLIRQRRLRARVLRAEVLVMQESNEPGATDHGGVGRTVRTG